MVTAQLSENKKEDRLVFNYLPAYASYLLEHKLEDFARQNLVFSREEKVPLLKFFEHIPQAEFLALAIVSSREFLSCLAENAATSFIMTSTTNFIKNRLPSIQREQVVTDDITTVSFVRRKTLRHFLTGYTSSFEVFGKVMEEVDRFIMHSESGGFNAFIEVQQDKINKVNLELERRQAELLEAQELANMGSFLWDLKDKRSVFTPGVYRILELTETENNEDFMRDVHEEDRAKLEAAIKKALAGKGLYECEYRYTRNGKEKHIWSRGVVTFENGKPLHMKGTIMDVTQKNKLLARLQESEALHEQAQGITHIGNWTWNVETGDVNWSDEMYRIYGLEPQSEKISFDRFISLLHPEDREKRIRDIQESLDTLKAKDYVLRVVNPDGKIKVLQGKGNVVINKQNKAVKISGTCQDITKEYNLNKNLQEKEAYLQELINSAPDAIVVIDNDNLISLWNPKTESIFGWKAAEVIGRSITEVIAGPANDGISGSRINQLIQQAVEEKSNRVFELTAFTKERSEINVSLSISQSVQGGKQFYIAFLRDITREKQIKEELEQKSTQLEQANERLNAQNAELQTINIELESFNYAASHDLKEPLRKIQVYSGRILEKKDTLEPGLADYFDKVTRAASRMQSLIEDLLMYSRATDNTGSFERVNLNDVVEEVRNTLATTIEERQAIIVAGDLPVISAIPFQVHQLILNLVSNSLKYSKPGVPPCIVIYAGSVKGQEGFPADHEYMELVIKDNGIGFEPSNAEKIFGLFQRLHSKDDYPGSGIGLALCRKIVHNHGGFIKAESQPMEGATFKVYLPIE